MAPRISLVGLIGLVILAGATRPGSLADERRREGGTVATSAPPPFDRGELSPDVVWNSATIYFLLIDRFQNGNPANDSRIGPS